MKLYGGIDLHSNNSVFSIKDETGEVMARRKLPNDIKQILVFLAPFKEQLTGLGSLTEIINQEA
jgi:transposase